MAKGAAWTVNMSNNETRTSWKNNRRILGQEFLQEPFVKHTILIDNKILLFILKTLGILPFFQQILSFEIGPPSKATRLYSLIYHVLCYGLIMCYMYTMVAPTTTDENLSDTDNINQWIERIICLLTYIATMFVCARNGKGFMKILNNIMKVDQEVHKEFGATIENRCKFSKWFAIILLITQIYILGIRMTSGHDDFSVNTWLNAILFALQNISSTSFIVFISVLMRLIETRFTYINFILEQYTYRQMKGLNNNDEQYVTAMKLYPERSLFAYRMHNKLLRIFKSTNDCCGLVLVAYMGYAFYSITSTTYYVFVYVTTQHLSESNQIIYVLQYAAVWLTLHTSLLALLSSNCGDATTQANITSQVLARIYNKIRDYQKIVDKFLTKSIKQEIQFTAYGFFAIDNSTLFSIFSAVTTYLVILIQFKQLEESKNEE